MLPRSVVLKPYAVGQCKAAIPALPSGGFDGEAANFSALTRVALCKKLSALAAEAFGDASRCCSRGCGPAADNHNEEKGRAGHHLQNTVAVKVPDSSFVSPLPPVLAELVIRIASRSRGQMESKLLKRNLEKTLFRFLFLRLRLKSKSSNHVFCSHCVPTTTLLRACTLARVCKGKRLLEYAYYELIE